MFFDAPGTLTPFAHHTRDWFERLQTLRAARMAKIELLRRQRAKTSLIDFTKLNYEDYQAGWVHEQVAAALDAFVDAVHKKLRPRLMINFPPGHGKSMLTSQALPAYVLGRFPKWDVVLATAGQDLSDTFGKKVRALFENPVYAELFPETHLEGTTHAAHSMTTTAGGSFLAVGVGGQLTGKRAHVMICDDLVRDAEAADSEVQRKSIWDWFAFVARTRLHPGGGIIQIQTRWHELDPCGMILDNEQRDPKADKYTKFIYPAIATEDEPFRKKGEALHPERWPLTELEAIKRDLPPRAWSSLFQQSPRIEDGGLFKPEWLEAIVHETKLPETLNWYLSVDAAISQKETADYTVVRPFAVDSKMNIYFAPPIREHMTAFELVEIIIREAKNRDVQYIAIERMHVTQTIGPYLRQRMIEENCNVPIWEGQPTKDKTARSTSLRGRMEQKRVFFIDHPIHHDIVVPEYLSFPNGKRDDLIDSDAWSCLMLDDLNAPPPKEDDPDDDIPPDSYEGMMARVRNRNQSRTHIPRRINGEERKRKTRTVPE